MSNLAVSSRIVRKSSTSQHLMCIKISLPNSLSVLSLVVVLFTKENLENDQGFSVPAECVKTLENKEKTQEFPC